MDIDLAGPPDVPGFISRAVSIYILERIRLRTEGKSKAHQGRPLLGRPRQKVSTDQIASSLSGERSIFRSAGR
jgi:hypothetical protein